MGTAVILFRGTELILSSAGRNLVSTLLGTKIFSSMARTIMSTKSSWRFMSTAHFPSLDTDVHVTENSLLRTKLLKMSCFSLEHVYTSDPLSRHLRA